MIFATSKTPRKHLSRDWSAVRFDQGSTESRPYRRRVPRRDVMHGGNGDVMSLEGWWDLLDALYQNFTLGYHIAAFQAYWHADQFAHLHVLRANRRQESLWH